ncbi:MAG: lantibiotic dehydratase, partial [Psychrobium sp.]|nr:lantibiotic dehydratase [Psychrobium sp.]
LNLANTSINQATAPNISILDSIIEHEISLPENRNKDCIILKSKQLKKEVLNKDAAKQQPCSFAVMLSLYQDTNKKPIFKFIGCHGPSSANLLGRFCHLDESLKNGVINELKKEQAHSPDVIFAEVVHIPEGRPGNVIARPHLREYEIVFMADSSLPDKYQIPLSDLHVWVEEQKIKLWSKTLNKQIIPRLSSAHNYSARSLGAYKFLCMLQHQDGRAPSFRLPESTIRAAFVPRVMLDNLILSEKIWRVERKILEEISNNGQFDSTRLDNLLKKYQLDTIVNFAMSDNVLQIDLSNPVMLNILLVETKGQIRVELKEVLTNTFESRVTDNEGNHYNNEIIVPLFNAQATPHRHFANNPLANINAVPLKRRFSAGSQWLSFKIYSGNTTVEELLSEKLLPLIEQQSELYQQWFFIRYGDPDWHIRLRFHGEPNLLAGKLLPILNSILDPMIESGELHKVELMTYNREVERYGGPKAMGHVESLFMFDSALIAKTCSLIEEYGEEVRWRIAINFTHRLLTLFQYSPEASLQLISSLRDGFGREFDDTSRLRKQLGKRFREYETQIKDDFDKLLCSGDEGCDESQQAIKVLLEQWQLEAAPIISLLNGVINKGELNCTRDSLLGSLLHMHNNRMFKAYGRQQELVVHDLLRRYYFSLGKNKTVVNI